MKDSQADLATLPAWVIPWLQKARWEELCRGATPMEFERQFQDIMDRARPTFRPTKPHGNLGDRGTDGFDAGTGTVYQVYSPDEIKPGAVKRKVASDLRKAEAHWGKEMKRWVFVYNDRGLPTDTVSSVIAATRQESEATIGFMSQVDVWRVVRDELSPTDRNEVLDFPAMLETLLPPGVGSALEFLEKGHIVLIHSTLRAIDENEALEALQPVPALGPVAVVRPSVRTLGWVDAVKTQEAALRRILAGSEPELRRFAVFPLSEIPLLVHLGYLLTDIVPVRLFQYDRFERTWKWPVSDGSSTGSEVVEVRGMPPGVLTDVEHVVVRVSLSARVSPDQTREFSTGDCAEIDVGVASPSRRWLVSEAQLDDLRELFHRLFDDIVSRMPRCRSIDLFYAGPAPGAVALGQAINPRMVPPIRLFQFDRNASPVYSPVLTLRHSPDSTL